MTIEEAKNQLHDIKSTQECFIDDDAPDNVFRLDGQAIDIALQAMADNEKLKRLLILACADIHVLAESIKGECGCIPSCDGCVIAKGECTKWIHEDEALEIINREED